MSIDMLARVNKRPNDDPFDLNGQTIMIAGVMNEPPTGLYMGEIPLFICITQKGSRELLEPKELLSVEEGSTHPFVTKTLRESESA